MNPIRKLSFRTQIFLTSMILVIIPTVILCAYIAGRQASGIVAEYNTSTASTLTQMNQALDSLLLQNAVQIADIPLLNDDAKQAMITNYGDDYLSYAQASTRFRSILRQTNRLNSALLTADFLNQYGYSFEYNISSSQHQHQIEETIKKYADTARNSESNTYFAPLQYNSVMNRSVLPMIKILLDGYYFYEIGICYAEIDFDAITDILSSSKDTQNTLLVYNAGNELTWSTNQELTEKPEDYVEMLTELSEFSNSLSEAESGDSAVTQSSLRIGTEYYAVNGCVNSTTQWRLVQLVNNVKISHLYHDTWFSYLKIFAFCSLLGLGLAILLSRILTRPVIRLCHEIDQTDPSGTEEIDEQACGSNQELRRLVASFNQLNRNLSRSLQQNYEIQLAEQQLRVQMLQFQINHHFLYNTLNIIRSLAEIHDVPQIGTIAVCMSDLLRYNLEKFPVARLEEELEQVQRYLTIQQIRFPGKFRCSIEIPEEFLSLQVPVFLLQPLVENSIEHGFASRETDCSIHIFCRSGKDELHLFVSDNGDGIAPETLTKIRDECSCSFWSPGDEPRRRPSSAPSASECPGHKGQTHHAIGLSNVSSRLRSYYGASYGLRIESTAGKGTTAELILPKNNTKNF